MAHFLSNRGGVQNKTPLLCCIEEGKDNLNLAVEEKNKHSKMWKGTMREKKESRAEKNKREQWAEREKI